MTRAEQIAWVAHVAWMCGGLTFWRFGGQALILPGWLWRRSGRVS